MRRLVTVLTSVAFLLSWVALPARAYTVHYTDSSDSVLVRWPSKTVQIALSSSLTTPPSNIKPGSDVLGAARRALARWTEAAGVQFIETSSDALSISSAGEGDTISLITVADTPENRVVFDSEDQTGRTRVFYDPATGAINEADVAINPSSFFSTDGTEGTYDLEATLTHEIGHVLGLEHSNEAGSIMQPGQGTNGLYQQTAVSSRGLSEDDIAGARTLYGLRENFGTISGTINDSTGSPAENVHVWAEDAMTGKVVAGNMSMPDGSYRLEGLAPGEYRIVAERGVEDRRKLKVAAGGMARRDIEFISESPMFRPHLFGSNGQLSTIAVPLAHGKRAKIFVGGEGFERVPAGGVSVTSPFIKVNPASVTLQSGIDYEHPIISFDVEVSPEARPGDYTIRFQSKTGDIAYVPGGLTIEPSNGGLGASQTVGNQVAMAGNLGVVGALVESFRVR